MRMTKAEDGSWILQWNSDGERAERQPDYIEASPRYVGIFEAAFEKAKERSEFAFVSTLIAVRSMQDAGWDPYESSVAAISEMLKVCNTLESYVADRHMQLWIYGHIAEASEPYELLANLLAIAQGETYNTTRFPPHANGRPQSPWSKIDKLQQSAEAAGLPETTTPLREIWDGDFRNAIFHSDYSVHGSEVRFYSKGRPQVYDDQKIMTLVNRAIAYFHALRFLRSLFIRSYSQPVEVLMHPSNTRIPGERAIVMVREGYGAIGLKDAWTLEEHKRGHIPWRYGKFLWEEIEMSNQDPTRALFPARTSAVSESEGSQELTTD
jgi:hypothetical protein